MELRNSLQAIGLRQHHERPHFDRTRYATGTCGTPINTPYGSRTRFSDIGDGASNTLAVGERPPSPDFWLGWWYAGAGEKGTGAGDVVLGVRERHVDTGPYTAHCPGGPYRFRAGAVTEMCDAFHYWSLHQGGANFLFCDGSVRFLSYPADSVFPALASRAGGDVADVP